MPDFDAIVKATLTTLGMWRLPVDPFAIAKEEGIELAPGKYGARFDARIEFIPAVEMFIIYFRTAAHNRTEGRVRFSVAHELGHFYLPGHRESLLRGRSHNSVANFRSREPQEKEADEFAAALLMPEGLFGAELRRRGRNYCTLSDLRKLADEVFLTSITSTVRRYCQFDWEACSVVISEAGSIRWANQSDTMKALGMSYVPEGPVPNTSVTARLWRRMPEVGAGTEEGPVEAEAWYEHPRREKLWEEAMALGSTGQVLTFLTLEDPENDDPDE